MVTGTPNIDGSTRAPQQPLEKRSKADLPGEDTDVLPRRIGLEQEFFLVNQTGALCNLADRFLRGCWQAAEAEGLDPHCFKAECVKSLVEITTPPSSDLADLTRKYLSNLNLALGVGSKLGLGLYPLGTYPLPIRPLVRDDPSYKVQARTIGYERFLDAGRCAGAHLHLELPAGTVWPDVKAALDAPAAAQDELLSLYNLATALDPALVALTRACPFYEGRMGDFAARTVHYRGMLGSDGVYADLQEVGALSDYATCVEDLIERQNERYRAWFAAMDLAGVERHLFASTGGNFHRASWNPVRLNHHGTLEIRSMDSNYPALVLAVCALLCGAADRVRHERLRVRPSRKVRTLEIDGDDLLVPYFSYLSGELLRIAVTRGLEDSRLKAYVDSFFGFASGYVEELEIIERLKYSDGYKTTESEVLQSLSALTTSVSRDQGLWLVRQACRRLREQVSSLRRTRPGAPRREDGREERTSSGRGSRLSNVVPFDREARRRSRSSHRLRLR